MTKEDYIKAGFTEEEIAKIMSVINDPADINPTKLVKAKSIDAVETYGRNEGEVTSIYDLQKYAKGQVVRLPDFAEGQPFIVRMRRPSILVMAKSGKIPNRLLATATDLFNGGGGSKNANTDSLLSDTYDVCETIAEAALIEPTFKEIKEAGVELSDDQLIAIFNYAQRGVEALNNFRKK